MKKPMSAIMFTFAIACMFYLCIGAIFCLAAWGTYPPVFLASVYGAFVGYWLYTVLFVFPRLSALEVVEGAAKLATVGYAKATEALEKQAETFEKQNAFVVDNDGVFEAIGNNRLMADTYEEDETRCLDLGRKLILYFDDGEHEAHVEVWENTAFFGVEDEDLVDEGVAVTPRYHDSVLVGVDFDFAEGFLEEDYSDGHIPVEEEAVLDSTATLSLGQFNSQEEAERPDVHTVRSVSLEDSLEMQWQNEEDEKE